MNFKAKSLLFALLSLPISSNAAPTPSDCEAAPTRYENDLKTLKPLLQEYIEKTPHADPTTSKSDEAVPLLNTIKAATGSDAEALHNELVQRGLANTIQLKRSEEGRSAQSTASILKIELASLLLSIPN